MLLVSIVLGIIPLAGIAWILVAGSITTVDGMFMSLILLTLSGIFFLNVLLELRDRGFFSCKKTNPLRQRSLPQPSRASMATQLPHSEPFDRLEIALENVSSPPAR